MVADAPVSRSLPFPTPRSSSASSAHVEAVLSRLVAVYGVLYALQAIPALLSQAAGTNPIWTVCVLVVLGVAAVATVAASITQRGAAVAFGVAAVLYLGAILSWPLAVTEPQDASVEPWLSIPMTAAMAYAAIALPTVLAAVYVFLIPLAFAVLRTTADGSEVAPAEALLHAASAIIMGATLLLIITELRRAARAVDVAQATALSSYSRAVREHAIEVERVQVDSIVHDSVLTTLLSAARAYTQESKRLAASMASNAIGHLRDAALVAPEDGSTVPLTAVARRITQTAQTLGGEFELRSRTLPPRVIPAQVADAIHSAAVQAMMNSLQHAGDDAARWLSVRGRGAGVEVEVGDSGTGFDPSAVPTERLGLRISIVERMLNAGGAVAIDAHPGEGSVVSIRWPAPDREITAGVRR
jgi:signal transduction histidine kinase